MEPTEYGCRFGCGANFTSVIDRKFHENECPESPKDLLNEFINRAGTETVNCIKPDPFRGFRDGE